MNPTFSLYTLGCKVNQCDADALSAKLKENGYIYTSGKADIYIVNTCTVTQNVDKKSQQAIRRARRHNPAAFIAVCGCMEKGGLTSADLTFDTRKPEDLLEALEKRFGAERTQEKNESPRKAWGNAGERTRAFLKVQDGCDRYCAYCIVPYVRGAPVSYPLSGILKQVTSLTEQGIKEIVLAGIQLSSYGNDTGDVYLPALIREIAVHAPELTRLRLSSLDPWAVSDDFLQAVAQTPALCDHFHLSLQSGCDATLALMNRRYTAADYGKAVDALRKVRPQAAITTDIIVGFPGESADDFNQSLSFAREMGFARIHVFPYSPRKGTKAAEMPDPIPPAVKKARNAEMLAAAAELKVRFLAAQAGSTQEVLFETPTQGHTRNYCMVRTESSSHPNTLANVHITGHDNGDGLKGVLAC
ncbi:MAG: tRNA (N(6)-L-threonylcarbamoyladenosine(37)-C(2))-methylthiotransferase MtaB [Defluviitaleaceae bacterium]|nr:tRNA (N(6)-L-threonylcarbamoyladenosine(37)-C(2))-methylthiotransferase MtaB [Defluviitaleaceae bacterium]